MAAFIRQKRQSRFYWAELGFMALGLLGLQPALFTNFLMGTQSKPAYNDASYANPQLQSFEIYKDWAASQLASILTHGQAGPVNTGNGWLPQPVGTNGALPSTTFAPNNFVPNQVAANYTHPSPYAQQQYTYPQQTYPQQTYAQQPHSQSAAYGQGAYGSPTYGSPTYAQAPYNYPTQNLAASPQNYAAQPTYSNHASSNQNQAAYMAQANPPYSAYGQPQSQWTPAQSTSSHNYSQGGYNPIASTGNNYPAYGNAGYAATTNPASSYQASSYPASNYQAGWNQNYNSPAASPTYSPLTGQSHLGHSNTYQPYVPNTGVWQNSQTPSSFVR